MAIYTQYSPVALTVTSAGAVTIPFGFQFANTDTLVVYADDIVVPASAYTINLNTKDPGGSVVITSAFNNAQTKPVTYVIARDTPLTQPDVYKDRAQISSETLEGSLDRAVLQIQERSLGGGSGGSGEGLPVGGASTSLLGGPSTTPGWRTPTEVADTLPFASAYQAGVVKVGSGLSVTSSGVLYNTGGDGDVGSGGGAVYHSELLGRDDVDQHPQAAITDLTTTLAGKAALSHVHVQSDITGLATSLAGKADIVHVHVQSDITGLAATLAGKAALSHTHVQSDITNLNSSLTTITNNITHVSAVTSLQSDQIVLLDTTLTELRTSMQWLGVGSLYNVMTAITDPTTWTVPATSNYLIMCLGAGGGGGAGGNTSNGGGAGSAGGPTYVWRNSTSQTICWGAGGAGGGGGGIHGCGGGGGAGEAVYNMVPLTKNETIRIDLTDGGEGGSVASSNTLGASATDSGSRLGGIGGTPWHGGGGASGAGGGACWLPGYGAGVGGSGGATSAPMLYAGYGAGGGGGGGGGTGGTSYAGLGGAAGSRYAGSGASGSNTNGQGGEGGKGAQGVVVLMYYDPAK